MVNLIALVLSILGFAMLALAMDRHSPPLVRNVGKARRTILRMLGAVLLTGSLSSVVVAQGFAMGFILWLGLLSPAALLVAAMMTARRKH